MMKAWEENSNSGRKGNENYQYQKYLSTPKGPAMSQPIVHLQVYVNNLLLCKIDLVGCTVFLNWNTP